jgi:hypothetical protein
MVPGGNRSAVRAKRGWRFALRLGIISASSGQMDSTGAPEDQRYAVVVAQHCPVGSLSFPMVWRQNQPLQR